MITGQTKINIFNYSISFPETLKRMNINLRLDIYRPTNILKIVYTGYQNTYTFDDISAFLTKNRHKIFFLRLSEFKCINQVLTPLKSSQNVCFSHNFRGNLEVKEAKFRDNPL